jgi:hypothetical protein
MKESVQPVHPSRPQKAEAGASELKGLGDPRQVGFPIKTKHFASRESRTDPRRVFRS